MTGRDADPDPSEPIENTPSAPGPRVRRRSAARPGPGDPVLPDITRDERDVGWGDTPARDDDEHLLREVPPHHGG